MATIHIPDETYQHLKTQAQALGITIHEMILPKLTAVIPHEQQAQTPQNQEDWHAWLADWDAHVQAQAIARPTGHRVDISRESFYAGCE